MQFLRNKNESCFIYLGKRRLTGLLDLALGIFQPLLLSSYRLAAGSFSYTLATFWTPSPVNLANRTSSLSRHPQEGNSRKSGSQDSDEDPLC